MSSVEADATAPRVYKCHVCKGRSFGPDQEAYNKYVVLPKTWPNNGYVHVGTYYYMCMHSNIRHLDSDHHLQNLVPLALDINRIPCTVCSCVISGYTNHVDHMKSKGHKDKMAKVEEKEAFSEASSVIPGRDQQHHCRPCNVDISGDRNLEQHNSSDRHRMKARLLQEQVDSSTIEQQQQVVLGTLMQQRQQVHQPSAPCLTDTSSTSRHCMSCGCDISGEDNWKQHLSGKQHFRRSSQFGMSHQGRAPLSASSPAQSVSPSNDRYCNLCKVTICGENNWHQHLTGKQHRKNSDKMGDEEQLTTNSTTPTRQRSLFQSEDDEMWTALMGQELHQEHQPAATHSSSSKVSSSTTPTRQRSLFQSQDDEMWTALMGQDLHQEYQLAATHSSSSEMSTITSKSQNGPCRLITVSSSTPSTTTRYCNECKATVCGEDNWRQHLMGKQHKKSVLKGGPSGGSPIESFHCETCKATMTGEESYRDHLRGQKHQRREAGARRKLESRDEALEEFLSIVGSSGERDEDLIFPKVCPTCQVQIASCKTNWLTHLSGAKHKDYKRIWETSERACQVKDGNVLASPVSSTQYEGGRDPGSVGRNGGDGDRDDDGTVYKKGLGYMLIINQSFEGSAKWYREGSDADVIRLHETFNCFNYEIRTEHDLSLFHIVRVLEETRKHLNQNPKKYSSLAVWLMSHGKGREIMSKETLWFDVDKLPAMFSKTLCPGLSGGRPLQARYIHKAHCSCHNVPYLVLYTTT